MNQWKIGPRLAVCFGAVVTLMVVMAVVLGWRLEAVKLGNAGVLEMQRRAATAAEWSNLLQMNHARTMAIAKSGGMPEVTAFFEPLQDITRKRIAQLQKELAQRVDDEKGKAQLAAIAVEREAYVKLKDDIIKRFKQGDRVGAQTLTDGKLVALGDTYVHSIELLALDQWELASAGQTRLAEDVRSTQVLMAGLLAGAVVMAAVLGRVFARSVTRPLAVTVAALDRIAAGDLSHAFAAAGHDEIGHMQAALARTQNALRLMVGKVLEGSGSVGAASAQIASGNQDLSVRTEQTSSQLQSAASSLESLTDTVAQTAASARTADQMASTACQAAEHGGEVVARVVTTMDEINASSRRIADIVGTIDSIAFQTNILALNAAVEAARAGEQGRGFAVVASEVRILAQRSADAAREIKGLIQASFARVQAGTELVKNAGDAMGQIVGSVRRVTDVIREISAATGEQSAGLHRVNEAVASLDQATHQNAALVEESAAAAEALRYQSELLVETVGRFKIAVS